ncbi:hypothetical protein CTheo_9027 [Ceratobasidium theobromae]|uniref:Uncharacterized protein n=1 Tax=Ceratobasidium theobromae TaxID=1582974 RepID=A0A5N5Q7S3_9AGAM|nr:hypothetical protein CTheo_9027 [Ceratobasidium theobromae]
MSSAAVKYQQNAQLNQVNAGAKGPTSPHMHITHTEVPVEPEPGVIAEQDDPNEILANNHAELLLRRQRRLQPDEHEEQWYIQDRDPSNANEPTDLFGHANTSGIDWDLLPEADPLDPFTGLTAEEILQLGFEQTIAQTHATTLTERDHYVLEAFNYRVSTRISARAFDDLRYAFRKQLNDLPTIFEVQTRVAALSGLQPRFYDFAHRAMSLDFMQMGNLLSNFPICH